MSAEREFEIIKQTLKKSFTFYVIEHYLHSVIGNYVLGDEFLYYKHKNKYWLSHYVPRIYDILKFRDQVLVISMFTAELFPSHHKICLNTTGYWITTKKHIIFHQSSLTTPKIDNIIVYNTNFSIEVTYKNKHVVDVIKDTSEDVICSFGSNVCLSLSFYHHIHGKITNVHLVETYKNIFSSGRCDKDIFFVQYINGNIYFYDKNGEYIVHYVKYPYILKFYHIRNYTYTLMFMKNQIMIIPYISMKNLLKGVFDECVIVEYCFGIEPFISQDELHLFYLVELNQQYYLCCTQMYKGHLTFLREVLKLEYTSIYYSDGVVKLTTAYGCIIEYDLSRD